VDFSTVEEATRWIEMTKGELMIQNSEVRLDYSHQEGEEWFCILVNILFIGEGSLSYPIYDNVVSMKKRILLCSSVWHEKLSKAYIVLSVSGAQSSIRFLSNNIELALQDNLVYSSYIFTL
jgi:hypothetical protein